MAKSVARLRIRVLMKETRETYITFWPRDGYVDMCIKTGVLDMAAGQERNDRGEVIRTFDRFERYVA